MAVIVGPRRFLRQDGRAPIVNRRRFIRSRTGTQLDHDVIALSGQSDTYLVRIYRKDEA